MSGRFKIIASVIALVVLIASTLGGVLAAQKLSEVSFGTEIQIDALDDAAESIGMVNFLILGVDEDGSRTDTMMLASIDGHSSRVSILSIPRDTRILLDEYYQKINAAIGVGQRWQEQGLVEEPEEVVIDEVKKLTGLPINYFLTVSFDGFKEIIDVLGGVDFNVPYDMDYDDPAQDLHIHLEKGQQHLDGQAAHDFVRFRHNNDNSAPGEYAMGDIGRTYWQQEFLKELVRQKLKPQYLSKITEIFEVVNRNVRTNFTLTDLMQQMSFLESFSADDIASYTLPGEAMYFDELWWFVHDSAATMELVNDVFMPRSREEWEAQKAEEALAASTSPSPSPAAEDEE